MIPAAQIPKITTDFKIFFTDVVRNFFTKKYISEAAQISVITIEYVPEQTMKERKSKSILLFLRRIEKKVLQRKKYFFSL